MPKTICFDCRRRPRAEGGNGTCPVAKRSPSVALVLVADRVKAGRCEHRIEGHLVGPSFQEETLF